MPGRDPKRGAILFTDIIGYRNLALANESQALELLRKERDLLFQVSAKHGGQGSKPVSDRDAQLGLKGWLRGAGLKDRPTGKTSYSIIIFDNPASAVRCAIEFQKKLRDHNKSVPRDKELLAGVGIDIGEYELHGEEVFGQALGLVSRIWNLAGPGGICITNTVAEKVRGELKEELVKLTDEVEGLHDGPELYTVNLVGPLREGPVRQASKNRIAVLPFTSLSPDPNDEYFTDGMTEEVISTISKINELEVISRTSVMLYKKAPKPVKELSKELDVGTVLEGSVRKAGNKLRVTVQMIDALRDRHLWANSYDREIQDVFAIQSDIAERVSEALKLQLASGEKRSIEKKPTESSEAYTLYLRAMQLYHESTEPSLREALTILNGAITEDPAFVRAHIGLARVWNRLVSYGYEDFSLLSPKGEAEARRAIQLEPDSAEAHATLADTVLMLDRFDEAMLEAERAIRINPNVSEAHLSLGMTHSTMGRLDRGLEFIGKAYELDPLSFHTASMYALVLRDAGREAEAVEALNKMRRLNQRNPRAYQGLAECHMLNRDFEKAQRLLDEGLSISPDEPLLQINQAIIYALTGKKEQAEKALREMQAHRNESVRIYSRLFIQAALGNLDEAFEALMRGAETHAWPFLITTLPIFKELRKDPRFNQFRLKVGLPA